MTTLQGNIRTIPEFDNGKVKAVLQSIVEKLNKREGFNLELIVDYDIYPVESKPDSELIKAIQAVSKEELPVTGISPTTDAAAFTKAENEFDVVIMGLGLKICLIRWTSMCWLRIIWGWLMVIRRFLGSIWNELLIFEDYTIPSFFVNCNGVFLYKNFKIRS